MDFERQAAGIPAPGVLEKRFSISSTSFRRFWPGKTAFLTVYCGRVLYLHNFIAKIDFGHPLDAVHFLPHSLHFWMKTTFPG